MKFSDRYRQDFFNHFLKGLDSNLQVQLSFAFQKYLMVERMEREEEKKRFKEEVVQEVLSRISVELDAEDVINEIEELRRAIDSLGERR